MFKMTLGKGPEKLCSVNINLLRYFYIELLFKGVLQKSETLFYFIHLACICIYKDVYYANPFCSTNLFYEVCASVTRSFFSFLSEKR